MLKRSTYGNRAVRRVGSRIGYTGRGRYSRYNEVMRIPKGKTMNDINCDPRETQKDSIKTIKKIAKMANVDLEGADVSKYGDLDKQEINGYMRAGKFKMPEHPDYEKDYWGYILYYYVIGYWDQITYYYDLLFDFVTNPATGFPGVENFYFDDSNIDGEWINLDTGEVMNIYEAEKEPEDTLFKKEFAMVALGDIHLNYNGTGSTENVFRSEVAARQTTETSMKTVGGKARDIIKQENLPVQTKETKPEIVKDNGNYIAQCALYIYPKKGGADAVRDVFDILDRKLPQSDGECAVDLFIEGPNSMYTTEHIVLTVSTDVIEPDEYFRNR